MVEENAWHIVGSATFKENPITGKGFITVSFGKDLSSHNDVSVSLGFPGNFLNTVSPIFDISRWFFPERKTLFNEASSFLQFQFSTKEGKKFVEIDLKNQKIYGYLGSIKNEPVELRTPVEVTNFLKDVPRSKINIDARTDSTKQKQK